VPALSGKLKRCDPRGSIDSKKGIRTADNADVADIESVVGSGALTFPVMPVIPPNLFIIREIRDIRGLLPRRGNIDPTQGGTSPSLRSTVSIPGNAARPRRNTIPLPGTTVPIQGTIVPIRGAAGSMRGKAVPMRGNTVSVRGNDDSPNRNTDSLAKIGVF
jgi:hypothetical protein